MFWAVFSRGGRRREGGSPAANGADLATWLDHQLSFHSPFISAAVVLVCILHDGPTAVEIGRYGSLLGLHILLLFSSASIRSWFLPGAGTALSQISRHISGDSIICEYVRTVRFPLTLSISPESSNNGKRIHNIPPGPRIHFWSRKQIPLANSTANPKNYVLPVSHTFLILVPGSARRGIYQFKNLAILSIAVSGLPSCNKLLSVLRSSSPCMTDLSISSKLGYSRTR